MRNVGCGLTACLASQDDNLTAEEIGVLVDTFPGQPLDFFGAIRCSMRRALLQVLCLSGDVNYAFWVQTELQRQRTLCLLQLI